MRAAGGGLVDINIRKRADVSVIQLRGDLRLGESVDKFRESVEELLAGGEKNFALDLAEVGMLDSSGIGHLMKLLTSAKKRGGSVKLINPSTFAVKTLKLVGVLNLFEIYESADLAVAAFG
jgi:anti-sigma B factor antagonist